MAQETNPNAFSDTNRDNWTVSPIPNEPYRYVGINNSSGEKFFGTLEEFEASLENSIK